ncbi:MAG: hypothetical protein H6641_06330 [Caldilineaceae bacterium]|nr:hypothetical protein [Caldilineaceae bacterium]
MSFTEFSRDLNRFVRVAGKQAPAAQFLNCMLAQHSLPVVNRVNELSSADDYLLVDPSLAVIEPAVGEHVAAPDPRLGYAGYSAQQRFELLAWLMNPTEPAAPAFQQLYLAHLETCLFEPNDSDDVLLALRHLQTAAPWRANESLQRAILLGYWLKQDGDGLTKWLAAGQIHARTLGVALGMAALLAQPLSPELLSSIWSCWRGPKTVPPMPIVAQRLLSLTTTLGEEPLAHALAQLTDEEQQPKPWRGLHRDLRIALPQPDLRAALAPLLDEMAAGVGDVDVLGAAEKAVDLNDPQSNALSAAGNDNAKGAKARKSAKEATTNEAQWLLMLEFGHSRSEYFDYVLHRARLLPSFMQIMDEDRQIVYRVHFRKRDMRTFWRMWDYVQNWSNTHVYLHGKELEKWKIWPYSQYMK